MPWKVKIGYRIEGDFGPPSILTKEDKMNFSYVPLHKITNKEEYLHAVKSMGWTTLEEFEAGTGCSLEDVIGCYDTRPEVELSEEQQMTVLVPVLVSINDRISITDVPAFEKDGRFFTSWELIK